MDETNRSEETTAPEAETITPEPSQDPIEQEIAREKDKGRQYTEAEKAAFNLKKNAERARELGVDITEVLGISPEAPRTPDKDAVVTVGMLEQMQKETAKKTALQLASEIADPRERELTIMYLENRIVPSGDPQEDLRFARAAVNSVKNGQVAEEIARKSTPAGHASAPGAPAAKTPVTPELTAQEQQFTRPPFNMTPAQIIAARPPQE